MPRRLSIALLVTIAMIGTARAASAQEAAASLEALAARLPVGERIWVTDVKGQECRGRLERLSADELVLNTGGPRVFSASAIERVRVRADDSLRNGTLIGLGLGGAMGAAWCIGAVSDDSGDTNAGVECTEGFIVYPALGALVGLIVDVMIPGKPQVVYQASPRRDRTHASLRLAPFFSSRARGLTVSFGF